MPLGQYFRNLEGELSGDAFVFSVLTKSDAFEEVVGWLCGVNQSNVHAVELRSGVVELGFQGDRYELEAAGARQTFETLPALLSALAPSGVATPADSPVRMSAPATGRARELKILIVAGAEPLIQDARLCASLIRVSNALWVVGCRDWRWDEPLRGALRSVCLGMDAVWPIVIGSSNDALPGDGWWADTMLTRSDRPLRPLRLDVNVPSSLSAFLNEGQNELRRVLKLVHSQRRLRQGLETAVERLDTLRQQQRARRQQEERAEQTLGEGAGEALVRGPLDTMRATLSDEITQLQKGLEETSRRSLARGGALARCVEAIVHALSPQDLQQMPGARTIALTLDDSFTVRAAHELRQAFKEELRRDLVTLRDGFRLIGEGAQKRLQDTLSISIPLDLPPPDERPIRQALSDVIQVQLRYRGELPKRGFLHRLGEGRRMIFAVLMTASLFGGFITQGGNVRAKLMRFGPLFIALFIGGVLWTYRSWARDDEERITKEIEKVREQLQTEAMRLMREGERERLSRLSDAIEQVRRDVLKRIDDFGRQLAQQAATNQARERAAVRDRLRIIDQKIKELDGIKSLLQRAEQDAKELTRQADFLLKQSLLDANASV
jgi:hypothetical protein